MHDLSSLYSLKNDGRDHEILKNIADGSIAVYNDWCTKPSDLKEVEDYIFRLMFWCKLFSYCKFGNF